MTRPSYALRPQVGFHAALAKSLQQLERDGPLLHAAAPHLVVTPLKPSGAKEGGTKGRRGQTGGKGGAEGRVAGAVDDIPALSLIREWTSRAADRASQTPPGCSVAAELTLTGRRQAAQVLIYIFIFTHTHAHTHTHVYLTDIWVSMSVRTSASSTNSGKRS